MSLRLLVLTADYAPFNWSGIGTAVAHQARALAEAGCKVVVLTQAARGGAVQEAENLTVQPLDRATFPLQPRAGDIIHLHSLSLAELALALAGRFRLPLFYTAHSLIASELPGQQRWIDTQRRVLDAADHVFFLNERERQLWAGSRNSSSVLANGLPARIIRRESVDGPIVFSGRFTRSKGVDIVLDVVRHFAGMGHPQQFVLAGGHGDGEMDALIRAAAERYRATCTVAGWLSRTEVDGLFTGAAMVLAPSRYEPFGMVALEAMQCGAPVLTSDADGPREVVTARSGGLRVASLEGGVWARAVKRLLDDIELRRELSRRGPRYVAERFDAGRLADSYLKIASPWSARRVA